MNILLLTRYDKLGASSRVRSFQYISFLEQQGLSVTVAPFFSNEYLDALYLNQSRMKYILRAYWRRLLVLFKISNYDLVVLEKELFPFFPAVVERLLAYLKIPYVADYDDALFHRYDCHRSAFVRFTLGKKIDAVMKNATVVVAGNQYLAKRAEQAGAQAVKVIPTVVDTERYTPSSRDRYSDEILIGWIGTPKTSHYVKPLFPVFKALKEKFNIKVILIGASRNDIVGGAVEIWDWSEATEVVDIQKLDIGIMPLTDSPWERGKCGYKLIQYMACGIPVIASPVGVNKDLIEHGKNGFLATSDEEWLYAFERLLDNETLRKRMGTEARAAIEANYSLHAQQAELLSVIYQTKELDR